MINQISVFLENRAGQLAEQGAKLDNGAALRVCRDRNGGRGHQQRGRFAVPAGQQPFARLYHPADVAAFLFGRRTRLRLRRTREGDAHGHAVRGYRLRLAPFVRSPDFSADPAGREGDDAATIAASRFATSSPVSFMPPPPSKSRPSVLNRFRFCPPPP